MLMKKRIFLIAVLTCLLLPTLSLAAAPPATGTNWLQSVTSQVDALTTTHGDALVDMGVTELNFIALMALIAMVVRWNLAHMVIGYRPVNFTIGDLFVFFFKLFACSLMLHYYFNPFPGTGISLHNLFASVAQAIASTLDQNIMNDFLTRVRKVGDSSERPVGLDLIGVIVYFGVMVSMALIDLAMFAVDAFGWVAYGLFSLFGPLAIPLYMTKNFSSKFWGWLDGLIVFSFYRAVSAGFSFIWLNVLAGFFDNTVAGDYSIGHWLAIFGTLIMLTGAFFWGMFKIPMITSMLFGGVGAAAQGFTSAVSGLITAAAEAALLA
jgi:type IV secretion system protein VirB6